MTLSISKFILLIIFISASASTALFAQGDLNNTIHKPHVRHSSTHKPPKSMYKRHNKNRMYSNECVKNYTTSKLNFQYVILTQDCENTMGGGTGLEIEWHNFQVGLGLLFGHGPFWKIKVKKQYKFCQERMGDVIE